MNPPTNTQGTRAADSPPPPPPPPPAPPPDNMPYTNYFDNPYLSDVYNTGPDYSLNAFFDSDTFFEQPITSVEGSSKSPAGLPPRLQGTDMSSSTMHPQQPFAPNYEHPAFSQFERYQANFSMHPTPPQNGDPDCFSPTTTTTTIAGASHPSSHSGDTPQQAVSPSQSPHMLTRESPSSPASASESSTPKRPARKRGRPKLDRKNTDDSQPAAIATSPTLKSQRSRRQPHNQVERKYREGLNSELERLRRAVPILRQSDEAGVIGQPRPSKAMILASAIDYIQTIERERDALKEEVDALRRFQAAMRGADRRNELMDEFLMDP